jgi:peptidoglycan/LPS O-acetylase OafA/YrhL
MTQQPATRLYFPGLNGLRFLAAGMVICSHIEQFKKDEGLPNVESNTLIGTMGEYGVSLFFVLSGFLITYLLLQEEKETGTVSIRNFYLRRVLRIWPLYYLLVILAFFVLPYFLESGGAENVLRTSFWPKLVLFVLFLPNLALKILPVVPFASQAWSVGTEEQFYLLWPWILKRFRSSLPWILVGIPVGLLLLRKSLVFLCSHLPEGFLNHLLTVLGKFLDTFNIEFMAIGGLAAWLLFHDKKKILSFLFHPASQLLLYGVILLSFTTGMFGHVKFRYLFNAILFAILILNLAANKKTLLRLENSFFRFLGRISYGLYMYHALCFYLIFHAFRGFIYSQALPLVNGFLYLAVFALTALFAWLSYEFLEKRFLRKKKDYSRILSGDGEELK